MRLGLPRGKVVVEPHNTAWDALAAEAITKLHHILQDVLIDAQHIGSTSIQNVCAKPIIDIVAGVRSFDELLALNNVLDEHGFIFRGQDHPGQYLYVCGDQDCRTHHIHVVMYNSTEWNNYINLRDYLNCHEDDAHAYSELKQSLAERYPDDRGTYTAMKSDFIGGILKKAQAWRENQET